MQSLLDYEMQWIARAVGEQVEFELVAQVPVTSLCPCSKAISEYGAHNQRSHVTVSAIVDGDFRMDELIRLVEDEASCELWGLLKRPDEKYVTERAYDNPKFVEDLVRDVAARLKAHRASAASASRPRTSNPSTTTRLRRRGRLSGAAGPGRGGRGRGLEGQCVPQMPDSARSCIGKRNRR